jgi:hypothetical protein
MVPIRFLPVSAIAPTFDAWKLRPISYSVTALDKKADWFGVKTTMEIQGWRARGSVGTTNINLTREFMEKDDVLLLAVSCVGMVLCYTLIWGVSNIFENGLSSYCRHDVSAVTIKKKSMSDLSQFNFRRLVSFDIGLAWSQSANSWHHTLADVGNGRRSRREYRCVT